MKKLPIFLLALCGTVVHGQSGSPGPLSLRAANSDSSVVFRVQAPGKGFLPPRMTAGEITQIDKAAPGLMVYNTTANCLGLFNYKWVCQDKRDPDRFVFPVMATKAIEALKNVLAGGPGAYRIMLEEVASGAVTLLSATANTLQLLELGGELEPAVSSGVSIIKSYDGFDCRTGNADGSLRSGSGFSVDSLGAGRYKLGFKASDSGALVYALNMEVLNREHSGAGVALGFENPCVLHVAQCSSIHDIRCRTYGASVQDQEAFPVAFTAMLSYPPGSAPARPDNRYATGGMIRADGQIRSGSGF